MVEKKRTWDEWKALGYAVTKGEKACGRNKEGTCVFSESQVTETPEMSPEEAEMYGYDDPQY